MTTPETIKPSMVRVLRAVDRLEARSGCARSTDLAKEARCSTATALEHADQLVACGLLAPVFAKNRNRRWSFDITPKGRELLRQRVLAGLVPLEGTIGGGT